MGEPSLTRQTVRAVQDLQLIWEQFVKPELNGLGVRVRELEHRAPVSLSTLEETATRNKADIRALWKSVFGNGEPGHDEKIRDLLWWKGVFLTAIGALSMLIATQLIETFGTDDDSKRITEIVEQQKVVINQVERLTNRIFGPAPAPSRDEWPR